MQSDESISHESLATLGVYALDRNDLKSVLKRAIDIGCLNLELDCAVIYVLDKNGSTFEINAQAGCAKDRDPVAIDEKWDVGYALNHLDKPTIVSKYREEKRFTVSPYLEDEKIISSIHIVIRGSEETYGVLGFYSYDERKFTDHELNFLQSVANIVGMAIQQRQSKEKLENALERSEEYQREILKNSLVERWQLGGYLHDNLGQMLASAKIIVNDIHNTLSVKSAGVSSEIKQLNQILNESIEGIRDLTHEIIPVDIEEEGVEYAFRFLMRHTQKIYDINCTLTVNSMLNEIKDRKLATHLYHVVQEGVKNATIHGNAQNIDVTFTMQDKNIIFTIKDDGTGISNSTINNDGRGVRLMRHRIELLNGSFQIENNPKEAGATITCKVPFKQFKNRKNGNAN